MTSPILLTISLLIIPLLPGLLSFDIESLSLKPLRHLYKMDFDIELRDNFNLSIVKFLAGLHKVHPAYRMLNAGRASFLGYLLSVINSPNTFGLTFFKPLRSCYGHIEDVNVTFGSVRAFFENFTCSCTK
jgi:hypothetical protein